MPVIMLPLCSRLKLTLSFSDNTPSNPLEFFSGDKCHWLFRLSSPHSEIRRKGKRFWPAQEGLMVLSKTMCPQSNRSLRLGMRDTKDDVRTLFFQPDIKNEMANVQYIHILHQSLPCPGS